MSAVVAVTNRARNFLPAGRERAHAAAMKRHDGRRPDELRPVKITPHYLATPAGSVLIEMGNTRVVCAVSAEDGVPRWMREQDVTGGWITAEYSMLPYASAPRKQREVSRGRPEGRTHEIQRLIGRALRAVVDLEKLGQRTLWIDCDVLQADGGTRTAAITGASMAMELALRKLRGDGRLTEDPMRTQISAISAGIVDGEILLDLDYQEDSRADVDANVVMTGAGELVEIQATGEEKSFAVRDLNRLVKLTTAGIEELQALQQQTLK